jgi:hypothetical protein
MSVGTALVLYSEPVVLSAESALSVDVLLTLMRLPREVPEAPLGSAAAV